MKQIFKVIILLILLSLFTISIINLFEVEEDKLISNIPSVFGWLGFLFSYFLWAFPNVRNYLKFYKNKMLNNSVEFSIAVKYEILSNEDAFSVAKSLEPHLLEKYKVKKFVNDRLGEFYCEIDNLTPFHILVDENYLILKHNKLKIGMRELIAEINTTLSLFSYMESNIGKHKSTYSGKITFSKSNPYLDIYISEINLKSFDVNIKSEDNSFLLGNNYIQFVEKDIKEFEKIAKEKLKLSK